MSSKCWQESLQANLSQKSKRLAVVGIGHELRGDDALGVLIIRQLQQHCTKSEYVLLVEGGSAPENITGSLRRFQPDTVLMIDAVDMNQLPGSIEIVDWRNSREAAASTHTLSLRLFADYLCSELNCAVLLLGVQPLSAEFDKPLTQPIQISVKVVANYLQSALA
jgi:hydrogenase 3 maturation protease